MHRSRATTAAVALLALTGVTACGGFPFGEDAPPAVDPEVESEAREAPADELQDYYEQELDWSECGEERECAQLTVPLSYDDPAGDTIELSVLRAPATNPSEREGSLVVNPGGPGGSGVEYARLADFIVSDQVRPVYDIVGFDPRGVGESAPITCIGDDELDEFLSADPTPDDENEAEETAQISEDFADACESNAGALLAHVSTVDAAKDMDILRAALKEPQLDFMGKSYGTFLGATYAGLYPDKVGAFVLDGAIDPSLTGEEMGLGQAEGFERATRAYVENCVSQDECILGDSVEAGLQRLTDFLDGLDADPLPVSGDDVTELTEGWGSLGIVAAMYDERFWGVLTGALEQAFNGDGSGLMRLANTYADRNADGTYNGNMMQVIYAVNCLDRPGDGDGTTDEETVEAFEEVAPTWGRYLSASGPCAFWPVEGEGDPEEISAAGSEPILVVGTTRDPATPYEWSEGLAQQLENGTLLTYEGDGHTAYTRSNECIDDAVDAYLLEGTVPEDGTTC